MDFNPLTETCAALQQEIERLEQRARQVADELQWYGRTDPRALAKELSADKAKAENLGQELQALAREIDGHDAELREMAPAIGTLWNPLNWFAKDQVELRRKRARLRELAERIDAQKRSKAKELDETRARVAAAAGDLQRHGSFDLARRQSDLANIEASVAGRRQELRSAAEHKRIVDDALAPVMQELQNLESRKARASSDLAAAETFDRQLTTARNSYQRAMIHEQCERRLGEGSPRRIVAERQKEIRQIERDHGKACCRAEEVGRKAARKVDAIVIDGNNLCYEGRSFIGLSALEALVPCLSRSRAVIVVFDSAIRRLLNADDSAIRGRLGSHATVHVVASRERADETILELASANAETYVLSNDRFGDFNEKPAVKDGRVIRHEIVNGKIFVHDLRASAAYR
jgi:rRNA-processing protein FCF1